MAVKPNLPFGASERACDPRDILDTMQDSKGPVLIAGATLPVRCT